LYVPFHGALRGIGLRTHDKTHTFKNKHENTSFPSRECGRTKTAIKVVKRGKRGWCLFFDKQQAVKCGVRGGRD